MHKIILPTHLIMGVRKPKAVPLNLNHYRNADFNLLNNMKILFDNMVRPKLKDLPYMTSLGLVYQLYMPTKHKVDIANICCIVDKFFCDTLKNAGKIPDDNMEVITSVKYLWGDFDKDNPRVEVTLMEIEPMKMTTLVEMTESEVNDAIQAYITKEFSIREGTEFKIQWNNDSSCSVTIGSSVSNETKETGKRRGRPPKTATEMPEETPEKPVEEPLSVKEEPTPEGETEGQEDASEATEGTIYPPPDPSDAENLKAAMALTNQADAIINDEPDPVAQEATVAPSTGSKSLFPSKETSSPTPAPETKTESKPEPKKEPEAEIKPNNTKSLFNLKGLTNPK